MCSIWRQHTLEFCAAVGSEPDAGLSCDEIQSEGYGDDGKPDAAEAMHNALVNGQKLQRVCQQSMGECFGRVYRYVIVDCEQDDLGVG